MKRYFLLLLSVCCLGACGVEHQFNAAGTLEQKGYFVEAGLRYEALYTKHPRHPLAPAALYRLGRIYQTHLKLYSQSTRYFLDLVRVYPQAEPWARRAMQAAMRSPDYFPLTPGSFWIEGDSASGGSNMRAEWTCLPSTGPARAIQRRIFAGRQTVATTQRYYALEAFEVRESASPTLAAHTVLMAYPYFEGKTWRTERDGSAIVYTILSRTATVKTKAGAFTNCLKVKEVNTRMPDSYKCTYYAPGVGWVLTTTGSAGRREHPNTELLSCKIVPEPAEQS